MPGRLGYGGKSGDTQGDVDGVLSGRSFGVVNVAYGAAPVIDSSLGDYFILTVTDGNAIVFGAPTNPPVGLDSDVITIEVFNNSGGVQGATTFNAAFLPAGAFTVPANGKRRTIQFQWNGAKWVEVNRAAADI